MVVLLPYPLGPRKPNIVPSGTTSDRLSTATKLPYFLTRLEMRIVSTGSAFPRDHRHQPFVSAAKQRTRNAQ